MAHARRKFFDLSVSNKSQIAAQALQYITQLYEVEREVKMLAADEQYAIRQARGKPVAIALHEWPLLPNPELRMPAAGRGRVRYSDEFKCQIAINTVHL